MNPIVSQAQLNSACINAHTLSNQQLLAMLVLFKAYELKGIGGSDYTNRLISGSIGTWTNKVLTTPSSGGLKGDAITLIPEPNTDQFFPFLVEIAKNAAVAAGGTTATDIQTRAQQAKCLENVSEDTLKRMLVLLESQLGVHKNYNQ